MKQRRIGQGIGRSGQGIVVLTPKGYLTGGDETDDLRDTINRLEEEGVLYLVINLAQTLHLNSTALLVLLNAHSSFLRRGGAVKLACVDVRIENIFVITKFSLVFDVYPTEEMALASFSHESTT